MKVDNDNWNWRAHSECFDITEEKNLIKFIMNQFYKMKDGEGT